MWKNVEKVRKNPGKMWKNTLKTFGKMWKITTFALLNTLIMKFLQRKIDNGD